MQDLNKILNNLTCILVKIRSYKIFCKVLEYFLVWFFASSLQDHYEIFKSLTHILVKIRTAKILHKTFVKHFFLVKYHISFLGTSCIHLRKEIDQIPNWDYFISPKMKSHVNTLLITSLKKFCKYFLVKYLIS